MAMGFLMESENNRGRGVQGYLRRLDGLDSKAADLAPVFEAIHKQFLNQERGQFSSQGGGKWAPLTLKYQKEKARGGQDPRLERASGALARALTTGRGDGAISEIGRDEARFGSDLKGTGVAQRGSGRRRRRLIIMTRKTRNRWVKTMREYLTTEDPL